MTTKIDPNANVDAYIALDGVEHINIYSKGKTSLGRKLSHFTRTPFIHPHYGPFDSMEGFWYWLRSPKRDDTLRNLSGKEAKDYGKKLPKGFYPEFWEDIQAANYQKVIQHPDIMQMLVDSELPFQHYYVFYPRRADHVNLHNSQRIIIFPRDHEVLCGGVEDLRQALREGRPTKAWEESEKRYIARISNQGKA